MRTLKLLLAMAVACSLISPMSVCAEEHKHSLVVVGQEVSTKTTDECCLETEITIIYECECGFYEFRDGDTERILHNWEIVCVDPVNNGYQAVCSSCGRTRGVIAYPTGIEKEDY